MSAKTHSSRGEVMRKSPLNRACRPYKKGSRLGGSETSKLHPGRPMGLSFPTVTRRPLAVSLTGVRSRPGATGRCLLPGEKQHPPQAGVQDRRKGGGCAGGGAGPPAGTHLADILCEAVPRARRPSTHKPKHSVTSGEFQSWSTGCGTRAPPSRTRVRPGPGQAQAGPGTGQGAHLGTTRGAVLHPLQVHGAEGRQGEAREPLVIVLVHTQREGGVRVGIARGPHRPQGGRNALVAQPGLQLG